MKVIRSRPEANFTQIWNHVLRDSRLDPMTLGVLCRMLSNADGWETTADAMWQRARQDRPDSGRGEGRRAYRAAFSALELAGYLERRRLRTKTGQFETVLILHDQPVETPTDVPLTDVPLAVSRCEQEEQDVSAGHNRRTANGRSVSGTSSRTSSKNTEEKRSIGPAEPDPGPELRSCAGPTQTAAQSQAIAPDDDTKIQTVAQAVRHVYQESIEDEDALRIWERFIGERQTTAPVRDPIRFLSKIFNDTPSIDSLLSNCPFLDDEIRCPGCGGSLMDQPLTASGLCPWCDRERIINGEPTGREPWTCPRCHKDDTGTPSARGLCVWCECELDARDKATA